MPPKKKVVADESAEAAGDGLFILIIERQLTTEDYHKIVEALPPGANYNGVRQRISKFRKEQRARMEELGWALPDGTATKAPVKTPTKSPKKRAVATEKSDEGGDAEAESPTKKPRARKPKKENAKKEIKIEDMADGGEMEDEGVQREAAEDAS
ncbi:hypothetical protein AA0111_g11662 [Alternaria arborescens]|uniref:hypothetical protein n=1 Tax=Alternaria arborescens TaxID=156630 RepID=UPI0010751972|nr:hypothetical protein AA0111_g11662 [Alternaria arborescens]RYO15438.1 hypothetical protein AA0111_g11662 [Alternaria arborescens]